MEFCTEISIGSLAKKGQELCGDKVEILQDDEESIVILSDGLGSGVKANILATLTSKIIITMLKDGAGIDEVTDTLVNTLPVCKERKVAYSTFTILRVRKNGMAHLVEYDNPDMVILRKGQEMLLSKNEISLHGKKMKESIIQLLPGDLCILTSDGVENAGPNQFLRYAWKREGIVAFVLEYFDSHDSAYAIKTRLLQECNKQYRGNIGDDSTVVVCKVQHKIHTHIMIGPPLDPLHDHYVVEKFMKTHGKKIICGGRTSRIVSQIIEKEVKLFKKEESISIPPMGYMEGIDLVTEGIITLGSAVELLKRLETFTMSEYSAMESSQNGSERLIWLLMESAMHVTIFMGRANNLAHDKNKGIEFGEKIRLVEELAQELKKRNKVVEIEYY